MMGLNFASQPKEHLDPEKIKPLIEQREKLRSEKNWVKADEIRNQLIEMGYEVRDWTED